MSKYIYLGFDSYWNHFPLGSNDASIGDPDRHYKEIYPNVVDFMTNRTLNSSTSTASPPWFSGTGCYRIADANWGVDGGALVTQFAEGEKIMGFNLTSDIQNTGFALTFYYRTEWRGIVYNTIPPATLPSNKAADSFGTLVSFMGYSVFIRLRPDNSLRLSIFEGVTEIAFQEFVGTALYGTTGWQKFQLRVGDFAIGEQRIQFKAFNAEHFVEHVQPDPPAYSFDSSLIEIFAQQGDARNTTPNPDFKRLHYFDELGINSLTGTENNTWVPDIQAFSIANTASGSAIVGWETFFSGSSPNSALIDSDLENGARYFDRDVNGLMSFGLPQYEDFLASAQDPVAAINVYLQGLGIPYDRLVNVNMETSSGSHPRVLYYSGTHYLYRDLDDPTSGEFTLTEYNGAVFEITTQNRWD